MPSAPAFQFYPGDWLSSTDIALMSPAEEGAYIRLLCHAWLQDDCGIPDSDDALAVLSRLGKSWKSSAAKIRAKFDSKNGRLYNYRMLLERRKQEEYRRAQSESGKHGADKRWGRNSNPNSDPNGDPIPAPNGVGTDVPIADGMAKNSSSSSSSSSTSNTEKPNTSASGDAGSSDGLPFDNIAPITETLAEKQERWFRDEIWPRTWRTADKGDAFKAFKKRCKSEAMLWLIKTSMDKYRPNYELRDTEKRPHLATWLNKGLFNEEPETLEIGRGKPATKADRVERAFAERMAYEQELQIRLAQQEPRRIAQ